MKTTIQAAAVTLIAVSTVQAQQAVQWRVQDGGNGHWYQTLIDSAGMTKQEAVQAAALRGGELFEGCSQEFDWFYSHTAASTPAAWRQVGSNQFHGPYIGLTKSGSSFVWPSGESCQFDRWDSAEPTNSGIETAVMLFRFGSPPHNRCHDVVPYSVSNSAAIEWSADCNNDGIVDYGQCRDGSLPDYNGNNIPDCCEAGNPCMVSKYPVQWKASEGGNGHWYQLVFEGHPSWTEARYLAEQSGGHLATLTSQVENDFAGLLSKGLPAMLLGGFQDRSSSDYIEPVGAWRWVTGEPWNYSNWGAGEPNDAQNGHGDPGEDYLYSWTGEQGFTWGDGDNICPECNPGPYLVEWSADCNGDGIVDYGQILQGQLVDADSNGVPDICEDPCPGDITNGGTVDAADLSILLAAWGTNGQAEFDTDIDGSGLVDGGDLALVLGGWGPCPE